MVQFNDQKQELIGKAGSLPVAANDEVARKLAMLIEGECEGLGPAKAAEKHGYTRQRYFQIRCAFLEEGSSALLSKPRGPKRDYRRTAEVVRQVIRHRLLDPDATPEVIARKMRQSGSVISTRSVERVIAEYGIQKKNSTSAGPAATAKSLSSPSRRNAPNCGHNPSTAIRSASSAACGRCFRTRLAAIWWAYGSWLRRN